MEAEASNIMVGAISGLLSSGAVGSLAVWYFQRIFGRVDNLETKLDTLQDEKLKAVADKMDAHVNADQSQRVLTELSHLAGGVARMESHLGTKIDRLAEQNAETNTNVAKVSAQRECDLLYLKNLDGALQKHKSEDHRNA